MTVQTIGRLWWEGTPGPWLKGLLAGPVVPSATRVTVLYYRQHLLLDLAMLL